jgi:hypothetical protein
MSYREIFTEAYNQVKKEESKQKPYVSSSNGVFSVLDADGKEAYKSSSYTLAQDYFKKNYDKLKEVKEEADHEISMARGELEAIADKALQLVSLLKDKSDEGNPLEAWVQSKITKAKDYINSVSDYMMYNPDMKQNEELEEGFSSSLKQKAKEIAKKFANNMTKAVDEIEKLAKGLSDDKEVNATLRQYNEDVDLEEGRIKDIFTANKEGESIEDIAKRLKISVSTVKSVLGEEKEVPKGYHKMPDGTIMKDSEHKKEEIKTPSVNPDKRSEGEKDVKEENLQELSKAEKEKRAKRLKDMERYYDAVRKKELRGPNKALAKKMLRTEDNLDEKIADNLIKDLQKAYGDLKGKTISPEMATKISKHLDGPSYDVVSLKQLMKADIPFISTLARNKIYKKTGKFEEKRLYVESITGLKNKAEKSGMPYSILKQVYDRGMAAWKSGHRPGAGQVQWALARVNSFVTKGKGTWGGADKDLANKIKGEKD